MGKPHCILAPRPSVCVITSACIAVLSVAARDAIAFCGVGGGMPMLYDQKNANANASETNEKKSMPPVPIVFGVVLVPSSLPSDDHHHQYTDQPAPTLNPMLQLESYATKGEDNNEQKPSPLNGWLC